MTLKVGDFYLCLIIHGTQFANKFAIGQLLDMNNLLICNCPVVVSPHEVNERTKIISYSCNFFVLNDDVKYVGSHYQEVY